MRGELTHDGTAGTTKCQMDKKNRRWTQMNADRSYLRRSAFIRGSSGLFFISFFGVLCVLGGSVFCTDQDGRAIYFHTSKRSSSDTVPSMIGSFVEKSANRSW